MTKGCHEEKGRALGQAHTRIVSALFMGIALVILAFIPAPIFGFLVCCSAAWLGILEWSELCFKGDMGKTGAFGIIVGYGMIGYSLGGAVKEASGGQLDFSLLLSLCLLCSAILVVAALWQKKPGDQYRQALGSDWQGYIISHIIFVIGGVIQYAGWDFIIRLHERSTKEWIAWIILVVIVDSAGYIVGRLVPSAQNILSISPKKTVSGTVAMIVLPILSVSWVWANPPLAYAAAVGIVALWGDLWVSLIKRVKRVKDTGQIIPGHGGVLDRLDSHLMVWACLALLTKQ